MNTCNTTSLVHKTVQENVINITFSPYLYQKYQHFRNTYLPI